MSFSSFTDKSCRPKESIIEQELESCLPLWQSLAGFIRSHYRTKDELKCLYGKSYGWALRFQSGGALLTAMFPNKGHFVTQIILNSEQLNQTETMKLHKNAVRSLESANLYREGKWLFIRTEGDGDIEDIRALLQLKLSPAKARSTSINGKRSG